MKISATFTARARKAEAAYVERPLLKSAISKGATDHAVRLARRLSLDLLVRINAPQLVLLDPAVKAVAGDLAPFAGAVLDRAQHADLQLCRHRAFGVGFGVDRRQVGLRFQLHGRGALARQQRVIDPAFGAVGIADAPPVLELGGDLDRQADLRI